MEERLQLLIIGILQRPDVLVHATHRVSEYLVELPLTVSLSGNQIHELEKHFQIVEIFRDIVSLGLRIRIE
jgi:hypothetical protein